MLQMVVVDKNGAFCDKNKWFVRTQTTELKQSDYSRTT